MKHHSSQQIPNTFLQGQELKVLSSYIASYIGKLSIGEIYLPECNTKYLHGGKGQTILLLHGIGTHKTYFRSLMKELSAQGYRVIAPDIPGFYPDAKLSSNSYTLRNLCNWLKTFTDALGLNRFTLVGNSVGASLAGYYAYLHQDQIEKLVLMSMPKTFNDQGQSHGNVISNLLMTLSSTSDVDAILSHCFYSPPSLPNVVKNRIVKDVKLKQSFITSVINDFDDSQEKLSSHLEKMPHTTLLIGGAQDPACKIEFCQKLERIIPNSSLHMIDKSKHLTFIEKHRLVLKILSEFLCDQDIKASESA